MGCCQDETEKYCVKLIKCYLNVFVNFFLSEMLCPAMMLYICSCFFHPGIPLIWFIHNFSRPLASIAYYIYCNIPPYGVDRVCTLRFVEFIIFVQQMHNIFVKNLIFL